MTNAELAAHFAALPPDEPATLDLLDADSGEIRGLHVSKAEARMLEQIDKEEFLDEEHADILDDEDREKAADQIRETWLGTPVIFKKW